MVEFMEQSLWSSPKHPLIACPCYCAKKRTINLYPYRRVSRINICVKSSVSACFDRLFRLQGLDRSRESLAPIYA